MTRDYEGYQNFFYSADNASEIDIENQWLRNLVNKTISHTDCGLDLGCGSGFWAKHLSEICCKMYAADIDKDAIAYCKQNHASSKIDFFHFDGKKTTLEDSSVSFVSVFWVLQEIHDDQNFIDLFNEIKRVLCPQGLLLVVDNIYSDVRQTVNRTTWGELRASDTGDIIRQFDNNTLLATISTWDFELLKHQETGWSFFESFNLTK